MHRPNLVLPSAYMNGLIPACCYQFLTSALRRCAVLTRRPFHGVCLRERRSRTFLEDVPLVVPKRTDSRTDCNDKSNRSSFTTSPAFTSEDRAESSPSYAVDIDIFPNPWAYIHGSAAWILPL